jgi:hypothetical protein
MAENWLIDRRSAMRHAKTKKKLSKQDFVDLLHKKLRITSGTLGGAMIYAAIGE